MNERERFDAAYYRRFYEAKGTQVYTREQIAHLARAVTSFVAWFGGDLETVLDIGAGLGHWGQWFRKHMPNVKYRGTDVSAYACKQYGLEQRNIATWRARTRFDLVICQGVLPYLSNGDAEQAIENVAAMSGGFLYLEAITREDWETTCDQSKTDGNVVVRTGAWYRKRLLQHYRPLGCGLYYARRGSLQFYELERAE